MGIEPHLNMWNYFFHTWLQQGLGTETVALGNVDIFVCSLGSRVATPSLNPNGGTVWPRKTFVGYNPCVMLSSGCCEEG
jgi:hypothetical protein